MKQLTYYCIFIICMTCVTACGGSSEDSRNNPVIEGNTYRQSISVGAEAAQQTVTLVDLHAAIDDINQSATWLSATKMSYTSGSPRILLTIEENSSTQERQANITIIDTYKNTVFLTVKQVKAGDPTPVLSGIDDPHDTPSNQPAYSRQQ